MTQTAIPIRPIWCAGCGDFGALGALDVALARLEIPRHKVMLITGIGCSGTFQNYTVCYGYHALHGRVLPTALGAKLANPELTVIGAGGDGDGFAIGAGHLVHTFKRNPSITYLVMNNGTYGLTKGQPSPTAKVGYRYNVEEDLDPIMFGLSFPGTTFLARGYTGRPEQLERLMVAAIEHAQRGRGLAYLEVLSPCVTYNDTYREWRARVHDVETDDTYDPHRREVAFQRVLELRREGRLPIGLLFSGERPSLESMVLDPEQTPPALQDVSPEQHLEGYRRALRSFMG